MTTGLADRGASLNLKEILVPIVFSRVSRKALKYARPFAECFGAKITLLHVVEPPPFDGALVNAPVLEYVPIEPIKKELDAIAHLEVGTELLNRAIVRPGYAFDVITEVAGKMETDLIVLTTHGYTGFKRVLVGSTAERIVRHAPCPVLVVRENEHEFV